MFFCKVDFESVLKKESGILLKMRIYELVQIFQKEKKIILLDETAKEQLRHS